MSNYLGFEPSECPEYYFVSYNNEDAVRVGEIAGRLAFESPQHFARIFKRAEGVTPSEYRRGRQ